MKKVMIIIAAAALVSGCHTGRYNRDNGMGSPGVDQGYQNGSGNAIQPNGSGASNLPGGDQRPNLDETAPKTAPDLDDQSE
jgi:hypothetical protein